MRCKLLIIVVVVFFSMACSGPSRLEQALTLAGENRAELEKVLAHYSKTPADSLKYRAACFLIENMPGHYFYGDQEYVAFRERAIAFAKANDRKLGGDSCMLYVYSYAGGYGALWQASKKVYDLHVITSGYLIENIELAFEAWQESPWCRHVTFDCFCEEILPYRINTEPLENWRRLYREDYGPLLDSLMRNKDSQVEAGRIMFDLIYNRRWMFDNTVSDFYLGAEALYHSRMGSCMLIANYAVYAFRAAGIPCGIDQIVQNPDLPYRAHFWNYMRDSTGRSLSFEPYLPESSPEGGNKNINRKKGKVYRLFFREQPQSLPARYKGNVLPPLLNSIYMTDVSDEYFEGATVPVYMEKGTQKEELMYLCVFNNKTWIPIACSEIKRGKAVFAYMDTAIAYQPCYYSGGELYPASAPLVTNKDGSYSFLDADTAHLQTIEISRKYPYPTWYQPSRHRSVGGKFQGANSPDFKDATTFHVHRDSLTYLWYHADIDCPEKFKYLRYCSAADSYNSMAEIEFVSDGKKVKGKVIGTEHSIRKDVLNTREAVFDGDPLTYFGAIEPDGAWAGLELEEPLKITEVDYIFRNDDNYIREGEQYELFYFSSNGRHSLGKRTGTRNGTFIFNNAPSKALFLLRNYTRGKDERIFTYENGKQVWW